MPDKTDKIIQGDLFNPKGEEVRPRDQRAAILFDLRKENREGREKGCECSVCDQYCKTYKRAMHKTMAAWLVSLAGIQERSSDVEGWDGWTHVRDVPLQTINGDYARLVQFGLIEAKVATRGLWKITPEGRAFTNGKTTAPTWVAVYDNHVIEEAEDRVDIREALGADFDYDDLMNGLTRRVLSKHRGKK